MKYGDAARYHTHTSVWCKDLIEIEVGPLLHQTNAAYLVDSGEVDKTGKAKGIWVPKSMCEYKDGILSIGEKFATEKGLL